MPQLTGPTIELFDRSEFLTALEDELYINPRKTAVMTIEMTKRRLNAATPLPPGAYHALLTNTEALLDIARNAGMPVMHVLSALRPVEAAARADSKFFATMAAIGESVSPYGSVPDEAVSVQDGTFKPDFAVSVAPTDYITKTKKSMSAFYQTDMEWLLRATGCDTIVLAGLSTNADILATAYEGSCRGMQVVTVAECVASIYGSDLHELGLQQLGRCQGWTIDLPTFAGKVEAATTAAVPA